MSMDRIREAVTSVWAKALLGLIIVSFVLTGVNSYLFAGADTAPAKVNGEAISRAQFEQAFEQQRARMEQQLGELFSQLAADGNYLAGLRQQVLDQLINETLLNQWIKELGLRVSDDAVREAIVKMPGFQVDGQFSNDVYLSNLRRQGLSVAEFRELVRSSLAMEMLINSVSASAFVTSAEAELLQQMQQQSRDVRTVTVDAAPFVAKASVSDEAVSTYYLSNPDRFQAPAQVAAEYVVLSLNALLSQVAEPAEQAVSDYYNQHKADYTQPEERRVAHILLSGDDAKEKIAALQQELAGGADFAALAKRESKDPGSAERGGELPWITPGSFDPAFASAAFKIAKVGDVAEVVQSTFGYHLIKLLEVRGGVEKPLAEVSAEIALQLKRQQAQELLYSKQQELINAAFETPDSLVDAAAAAGFEVKRAPLFSADKAPAELSHEPVLAKLFDEEFGLAGQSSDLIEISDELAVMVRPTDYQPPKLRPLDEVKAEISSELQQQQGNDAARALAEQLLAAVTSGDEAGFAKLLADNQLTAVDVAAVARSGEQLDEALRAAAFELPRPAEGKVSAKVTSLTGGKAALVVVTRVNAGQVQASADDGVQAQLAQQYGRAALENAIAMLRAQAEISYPAAL